MKRRGLSIEIGIKVKYKMFAKENTTKLKYKGMAGKEPLSDHVPLEIEITERPV